ncbi:hypothetical protein SDC9_41938 [bioreactor metagenome]|uniref:Uncharacterized protein n=1 Tax=bioreactor metagenome TaxID=1076179 RepID=A0A644VWT3_9ZZZZ
MDSPSAFGLRNTLDTVNTAFPTKRTVDILSADGNNQLLVATDTGFIGGKYFHFPSLLIRVVRIHSVQVCCKQGSFLATGTGPDFHDDILAFQGIGGDEQYFGFLLAQGKFFLKLVKLFTGHFKHLLVGLFLHELMGFTDLGVQRMHQPQLVDDGGKMRPLLVQAFKEFHVLHGFRTAQFFVYICELFLILGQFLQHSFLLKAKYTKPPALCIALLDIQLGEGETIFPYLCGIKTVHSQKEQSSCKEKQGGNEAHMQPYSPLCRLGDNLVVEAGELVNYKEYDSLACITETHEKCSYTENNPIITTLLIDNQAINYIGHGRTHEGPETAETQSPKCHPNDE